MSLLLDQLGVLESHDQLELFLLHAADLLLIHLLFVRLSSQLLFNLSARSLLSVDEIHLALGGSLVLLHFNHRLDLLGTLLLVTTVDLMLLSVHFFVSFGFHGFLFRFEVSHLFVLLNSVVVLLFDTQMVLGFLGDLVHLVLLSLELLVSEFHVAATLAHDVGRAFAGLVDLPNSLAANWGGVSCVY